MPRVLAGLVVGVAPRERREDAVSVLVFLRVLVSIVHTAMNRADRAIGAAYMLAPTLGVWAPMHELRFGRAWCRVLELEVDVNLHHLGFSE